MKNFNVGAFIKLNNGTHFLVDAVALYPDGNVGMPGDLIKDDLPHGYKIDWDEGRIIGPDGQPDTQFLGDEDWMWFEPKHYESRITTGIEDKNKKPINEHDIIRDDLGGIWEVVFLNGCFWLKCEGYNTTNQMFSWPEHCYPMFRADHSKYSEVIGNKFQNPELLPK